MDDVKERATTTAGPLALPPRTLTVPAATAALVALLVGGLWAALSSLSLVGDGVLASELSVPGSMSAALLLAGSYPAWLLSWRTSESALVFAASLVLVSFAELVALHHGIEAASGVDWQLLYLPVAGLTILAGRRTVMDHVRHPLPLRILRAGGVAWIGALLLEAFQWSAGEGTALHAQVATTKDLLEIVGSALLFVALSITSARASIRD